MNIKLANKKKITIKNSRDIYDVMQRILLREQKVDRRREHFWTISLDNALKILNIELVSMGSFKSTVVEPMEVFSIPLQKRAASLVLVHNHPAGILIPSPTDEDLTDQLIQVGLIMHVPILDHLIISETSYYSFKNAGLLDELSKSIKYLPKYKLEQRFEKQLLKTEKKAKKEGVKEGVQKGEKNKATEMAKVMLKEGMPLELIIKITALTKAEINKLA
jgi:DNA repair protein RadC